MDEKMSLVGRAMLVCTQQLSRFFVKSITTRYMSTLDELNALLDEILPEFAGTEADQIALVSKIANDEERKQRINGYDPISQIPVA